MNKIKKMTTVAVAETALLAGAIASVAGSLGGADGVLPNLVQIGAPTACGALINCLLTKEESPQAEGYLKTVLIGGGSTVAILVAAGAYQFQFDTGSLLLIALTGASIVAAEAVLNQRN